MLNRYEQIAQKNNMCDSYTEGILQANNAATNTSAPLSRKHWDRFIGKQAVKDSLLKQLLKSGIQEVQTVCHGKGTETINEALSEAGISISDQAECKVISTLSPGPMCDAHAEDPSRLCGWNFSM